MLIREQGRDLRSVWSGPLCCVYTEFFITGQRRRKRKVFIALIISSSWFLQDTGVMEKTDLEKRSCVWKVLSRRNEKVSVGIKACYKQTSFVRPCLKAEVFIPVTNGHTRRQSEQPAIKERGEARWVVQMTQSLLEGICCVALGCTSRKWCKCV